jgi:hypothetical protein
MKREAREISENKAKKGGRMGYMKEKGSQQKGTDRCDRHACRRQQQQGSFLLQEERREG